jgi:short-subunit dehydrogenase
MDNSKIWYITGASKGLGLALVKKLLEKGQKVAATSRNIKVLAKEVENKYSSSFLAIEVDLTSEHSIKKSIESTVNRFKGIDVVVNNAGYGTGGAIEELYENEIKQSFEVNFFAVIKVIQCSLPYMREKKSGHIINISSIAGFAPGTGWSVYGAAKAAINGLSEGLANELKPLGINVSIVSPGWFRTSFAKEESIDITKNHISEYQHIRSAHTKFKSIDGNQIGNPVKVASVLLKLVSEPNPPLNLFIGSDAYDRASHKINVLTNTMKEWKSLSFSTDFD